MAAIFLLIVNILSVLPPLIQAIRAIEDAIPASGQGKEKRDLILSVISDLGEKAVPILPQIESLVNRIVGLFNATGTFQKKA